MLHQTKTVNQYVVEYYELTHWWFNTNGYRIVFDYNLQHFTKIPDNHWSVRADCYKKVFKRKFKSKKQVNDFLKKMGVKKKPFKQYFENSLQDSIKGYWGNKGKALSAPQSLLIIKNNMSKGKYFY